MHATKATTRDSARAVNPLSQSILIDGQEKPINPAARGSVGSDSQDHGRTKADKRGASRSGMLSDAGKTGVERGVLPSVSGEPTGYRSCRHVCSD